MTQIDGCEPLITNIIFSKEVWGQIRSRGVIKHLKNLKNTDFFSILIRYISSQERLIRAHDSSKYSVRDARQVASKNAALHSSLRVLASAYANFQTNARAFLNSANWRAWPTDYKYHILKGNLRSSKVTRGHRTFQKYWKDRFFQYLNSSYLFTEAPNQNSR